MVYHGSIRRVLTQPHPDRALGVVAERNATEPREHQVPKRLLARAG